MIYHRISSSTIHACQIDVDNLDDIAKWCRGSIRGTSLSREHQSVAWYNSNTQVEHRADVGNWVVKFADYDFEVLANDVFMSRYGTGLR